MHNNRVEIIVISSLMIIFWGCVNSEPSSPTPDVEEIDTIGQDVDWPDTPETVGHERQWTQVITDEDLFRTDIARVTYDIRESELNELKLGGENDSGDFITISFQQGQDWPIRESFSIPPDNENPRRMTGIQIHNKEEEGSWWESTEGEVYDIEVSENSKYIAGKFEAELNLRPNDEESIDIQGAFRGGLLIGCTYELDDGHEAFDREFQSETCKEYKDLLPDDHP